MHNTTFNIYIYIYIYIYIFKNVVLCVRVTHCDSPKKHGEFRVTRGGTRVT